MDALPVRSPREKIGGLVHFGRMLHKLRLHAQDRLSADYVDRLGRGLDGAIVSTSLHIMTPEYKLRSLGLTLPAPPRPAGNYQPWILRDNLLFLSGQFPIENGQLRHCGRVGAELSEAQGRQAARLAALNVLAQIHAALGGFERLATLLRVEGHVAGAPGWNNAPTVLDGASDLFAQVLGERGRHTRTAFTPAHLPLNLAVELVVTAAVRPT